MRECGLRRGGLFRGCRRVRPRKILLGGESLAPGLDVDDVLGMEAVSNVVGVLDVLLYGYDGTQEPPLRGYVHH